MVKVFQNQKKEKKLIRPEQNFFFFFQRAELFDAREKLPFF